MCVCAGAVGEIDKISLGVKEVEGKLKKRLECVCLGGGGEDHNWGPEGEFCSPQYLSLEVFVSEIEEADSQIKCVLTQD